MTSPARSFIVPVEGRNDPSREPREPVFEVRFTTPLGFSVGEMDVVLESGEGRDGERGLVDVVFASIAKEGAEAVEEELVLVCRFRD